MRTLFSLFFILFASVAAFGHTTNPVQASASLLFYIEQAQELAESNRVAEIAFSQEDLEALWDQLRDCDPEPVNLAREFLALAESKSDLSEKRAYLQSASDQLTTLWSNLTRPPSKQLHSQLDWQMSADFFPKSPEKRSSRDLLEQNPHLSSAMRRKIKTFLLPDAHPLKPALDAIFTAQRATVDDRTLTAAGFNILFSKSRSFIRVVRHPQLPGHLLKLNLDTEKHLKKGTPAWVWLTQRCQGAKQVREVIVKKQISHFQAPRKWLYPLPAEPSPPADRVTHRQPVVLLVRNMQLVSLEQNLNAWKNKMDRHMLDELYIVISHAHGTSYRPDNIWLSRNGKFSFIDTEYPNNRPTFHGISSHLNPQNRLYWEKLVRRGGP